MTTAELTLLMKSLILFLAPLFLGTVQAQIGTNLVVDTFAGSDFQGTVDGQGTRSMFNQPYHLAINSKGQIYCWQGGDGLLRSVSPDASVSTLKSVPANLELLLINDDTLLASAIGL